MAEFLFDKVESREPAMIYAAHESLHVLTILFLTHADELNLDMLTERNFEG